MKKIYLLPICLLLLTSLHLYSQSVNKIPLADIDAEYIEIVGSEKLLDNSFVIDIDYGQKSNAWGKNRQLKDSTGRKKEFNSMVDALNYLTKQGYEFVQAYTYSNSQDKVTRFLLRRKK